MHISNLVRYKQEEGLNTIIANNGWWRFIQNFVSEDLDCLLLFYKQSMMLESEGKQSS